MAIDEGPDLSVGDLADRAGVSVRTLHHYDRLGLLVPGERSSAGHRRYSPDDVERLFEILALRGLGFGLAQIGELLDGERDLLATAWIRLEAVDRELEELDALRADLSRIVAELEGAERPGTSELLEAMEKMTSTINLTRIYTRSGDDGRTRDAGGEWIAKTDPRVEALGAVDELCAHTGLVLAAGPSTETARRLEAVQQDLFDLGADLATVSGEGEPLRLDTGYTERIEAACDRFNEALPALDSFVVPAGSEVGARLHVARTIARRAERRVIAVENANPEVSRYLNRLSDLLFILARFESSGEEVVWDPARPRD